MNNLASDPAYADVLSDLQRRMNDWQTETDDSIVHGIPVPPAKQNKALLSEAEYRARER